MGEWTIKKCLDWTNEYLGSKGDENPRLSAEWLLTAATGLPRISLYMDFNRPLTPQELDTLHRAVVRRAQGEPLQYITGETQFRAIDVACEPGVLIPRPETEMLVEEVLTYLDREVLGESGSRRPAKASLPWNAEVEAARKAEQEAAAARAEQERASEGEAESAAREGTSEEGADESLEPDEAEAEQVPTGEEDASAAQETSSDEAEVVARVARVLEVGCGTGCISLSLAFERPGQVRCVATDIEPRAVSLTSRNRDALGISPDVVDVREGNLVSPLNRETEWGTFDVLVSNPPYIPTSVMAQLPREVAAYEPHVALEGGADGLDIFRRLVNAAPSMLRPDGLLACELHETTLRAAADLCVQAGFEDVRIAKDLAGRDRIILARIPEAAVLAARERFARRG